MRIDKHTYYLNIAGEVAKRSSCIRSAYGSVIVKNDVIKSTGYNGSCRGATNCSDINFCHRDNAPSRTGYDSCLAVHSEENSIASCQHNINGATLYITSVNLKTKEQKLGIKALPCWRCYRLIVNVGITSVCVFDENMKPIVYKIEDLKFVDPISYEKHQ